jgi:hypothetical protein
MKRKFKSSEINNIYDQKLIHLTTEPERQSTGNAGN